MNRTPEQQWSELSALYEEADQLSVDALAAWLARLEREIGRASCRERV